MGFAKEVASQVCFLDNGLILEHGSAEQIAAEVRAFADLGLTHLVLHFATTDPAELAARAERFAAEVAPLV
jgi:ABC-type glutathione transport system ATPase component